MALSWLPDRDFAAVVDTLESISLHPCGEGHAPIVTTGWRFRETVRAEAGSRGGVTITDTAWQLPEVSEGRVPAPGDLILDELGGCSTIRTVSRMRGNTRIICESVRVRISGEAVELVDLLRPLWVTGETGPVVTATVVLRPGIRALVVSLDLVAPDVLPGDATPKPPERARVTLISPVEVRKSDRLMRRRGGAYQVIKVTHPEELGGVYELEVALAP